MQETNNYSDLKLNPWATRSILEEKNPEVYNGQVINGAEVIKNSEVDSILEALPREGKLLQGLRNSYILEIPKDSLNNLYNYLTKEYGEGLKRGSAPDVGPHISVIRASIGDRIIDKNEMGEPLDKTFPFEPLYLASVIPDEGPWGKIWMVVVKAEGLEKIRTDLGMGPKIKIANKEHEFHISIANLPK